MMTENDSLLLTGGTGFVGQRLLKSWRGDVHILTRDPERARRTLGQTTASLFFHQWDAGTILPSGSLPPISAVVHLAGDSVADGRWNGEKKQRIRDSRVLGTRCLIKSLENQARRPSVFVSASAVGFYGDRPGEDLTETSGPGSGFLPDVCQEWEAEATAAESLGIRVCKLRIGVVLDPAGGALGKMLPIFRSGLGGTLGWGNQYFPWIHLEDLLGLIRHSLFQTNLSGPINAVAPTPTTNAQFTKALGRAVSRPTLFPAPRLAVRLALGEFANSLFETQKISPTAALKSGYKFQFPDIDSALQDLLNSPKVDVAT